MRNFQGTFETRKRSFISAFSIYMSVPLIFFQLNLSALTCRTDISFKNILRTFLAAFELQGIVSKHFK